MAAIIYLKELLKSLSKVKRENENSMVQKLINIAQNSRFAKNAPETQVQSVNNQLKQVGMGTMYVDAASAAETENGQAALNQLVQDGIVSEQELNDSITKGTQLEISPGAYFQTVTEENANVISEYSTFDKGGKTLAAIKESRAKMQKAAEIINETKEQREAAAINGIVEENFTDPKEQEEMRGILPGNLENIPKAVNDKIEEVKAQIADLTGAQSKIDYIRGKNKKKSSSEVVVAENATTTQNAAETVNSSENVATTTPEAMPEAEEAWYTDYKKNNKKAPTIRDAYDIAYNEALEEANKAGTDEAKATAEQLTTLMDRLHTLEGLKEKVAAMDTNDIKARTLLDDEAYKQVYVPVKNALMKNGTPDVRESAVDSAITMARIAQSFHENYGESYENTLRMMAEVVLGENAEGFNQYMCPEDQLSIDVHLWNEWIDKFEQVWNKDGRNRDPKGSYPNLYKWENEGDKLIPFMRMPAVLQLVGVRHSKIKAFKDFFIHTLKQPGHQGMTLEMIRDLPEKMVDPVMVLKGNKPNSIMVVLDELDTNHAPTVAIIKLKKKVNADDRNGIIREDVVITYYPLNEKDNNAVPNYSAIVRAFKFNEVLYINKKKSTTWLARNVVASTPPTGHNSAFLKSSLPNKVDYVKKIYEDTEKIKKYIQQDYEGVKTEKDLEEWKEKNPTYYQTETESDPKDYVAYHNISEDNLLKSAELGGLPMPSIAVTKKGIPFNQFGGITLIGAKDIVDPKKGTDVWSRDAYTMIFPNVKAQYSESGIKEFEKKNKAAFEAVGRQDSLKNVLNNINNLPPKNLNVMLSMSVQSAAMKYRYITEVLGKKVEIPKKENSEIDQIALDSYLSSMISKPDFQEWVKKEVDSLGYKPALELNGEIVPLTLDNILKIMLQKRDSVATDNDFFKFSQPDGAILAAGSKKYGSIEEMKSDRDNLVQNKDGKADYDAFSKSLKNYRSANDGYLDWGDSAERRYAIYVALKNALKGEITRENLVTELRKQGLKDIDIDSPIVDKGMEVADLAKKVKTDYFEAKPARAVSFNEFKGAVVPKGTSQAALDFLKSQGLDIVEYDPDVPGDRQAKQEQVAAETQAYFQTAWHGSPYDFDQFDLGKIGSGDGKQLHGWGLYFAKDKKVADTYKNILGDEGTIYEVDVPEDTDLLDESKVFDEQPENVKKALQKLVKNLSDEEIENLGIDVSRVGREKAIQKIMDMIQDSEGGNIYGTLYDALDGDKEASLRLNEYGIKGIAYEDSNAGRGFVVFDDKAIKIITKYNKNATWGDVAEQNLQKDEAAFAEKVDAFMNEELPKGASVTVMRTPLVMKLIGAPMLPININGSVLDKILKGKHANDITADIIKQVPRALANPIAIVEDKNRPVVILDLKDANGDTIIVPFVLEAKGKFGYEVNLIASIYGKQNIEWYRHRLQKGLLYINNEKAADFKQSGGLQLPLENEINSFSEKMIPNENDLVKLWKENPNLYQNKDQRMGAYDPAQNIIALFSGANQSTLVHETAHMWLTMLEKIAETNEKAGADLYTIQKWAAFSEENLLEYKGTKLEKEFNSYAEALRKNPNDIAMQKRYIQERFARGFERYLATGSAPTKELRGVFRRFKKWLLDIYQDVKNLGKADPPEEVKRIFDSMLATEKEVDAWAAQRKLDSMDMGIDFSKSENII